MTIECIVSGAQTGADCAAFDAAIEAGTKYKGRVPKGRHNENGLIPVRYKNIKESYSRDPEVRTKLNVHDSDATLILSHGPLSGGSKYTLQKATELSKPVKHIDLSILSIDEAVILINVWIETGNLKVLNVAGPRASEDPEIYVKTREVIRRVLMS